jgi:hypothetical protein
VTFDPLVITLPQREVSGLDTLADMAGVSAFEPRPLSQALASTHDTDAHFLLYSLPGEARWPRLNKPVLAELETRPEFGCVALDWDMPAHAALTPEGWQGFLAALEQAPELPRPTYLYPTTHGARLIFVLTSPTDAADAEALHRGLVQLYADAGVALDPNVWDWARCHRLPDVVRDGQRTGPVEVIHGPLLAHGRIPRPAALRSVYSPATLCLPQPTEEECHALLYTAAKSGRGEVLTPWAREAKRRASSRLDGLLEPLFRPEPPPPLPDPRNTTLMRMAGSLASSLLTDLDTTPEHLYALLLPSVIASIRPDDHARRRNLPAEAWKIVLYCYAREEATSTHLALERQDLASRLASLIRRWPSPPTQDPTPAWLSRHLIVSVRDDYYLLQNDGFYSPHPYTRSQLVAAANDPSSPLHTLVPRNPDKALTAEHLLSAYHAPLAPKIQGRVGHDRNWIELAPTPTLHRGLYARRQDLSPEPSPAVAEWLQRMFGPRYYSLAERWIGLALAIERGPICALSIAGDPGIGKKMLVQGLAECFTHENYATASIFGDYQYGLDSTPILNVNEHWPPDTRSVDGTFRALVGGDPIEINQKYEAIVQARLNPRVILTANNRSVVEALFSRRCMTNADQAAIAARLFHVDLDADAAAWLARRGGPSFTAGWIRGDLDGQPSRYTIARHFLHLYQLHGQAGGATRFLMQDATDPDVIWRLTSSTGTSPEIAELLVTMCERGKCLDADGGLWVTAAMVLEEARSRMFDGFKGWDLVKVGRALAPFVDPSAPESMSDGRKAKKLHLGRLRIFALDSGLPSRLLCDRTSATHA